MNVLDIKNLTKTYDNGKGVFDINIELAPGDCYAIIGHNGAGKTTTIKCICGINEFKNGEILINGHSIKTETMQCKQDIAYLPDDPQLYDFMTGIQYVNFICDLYSVPKDVRQARIEKIGDLLDIKKDLSNMINGYSHGMKQKLAILAAFVHEPKLIIMDEPFVGLDPVASFNVKKLITEYTANGNAVFFSSHVLEVVEKLCNKVAIIQSGKIILQGDTKKITSNKSLENIYIDINNNKESAPVSTAEPTVVNIAKIDAKIMKKKTPAKTTSKAKAKK